MSTTHGPLYFDRTAQDWHRTLPISHTAIDIDLMGYCRECYDPMYLIESTTRDDKPTGVLVALARRAAVPAFCVVHDTAVIRYATQVHPSGAVRTKLPLDGFIRELFAIRRGHYEARHPYAVTVLGNEESCVLPTLV